MMAMVLTPHTVARAQQFRRDWKRTGPDEQRVPRLAGLPFVMGMPDMALTTGRMGDVRVPWLCEVQQCEVSSAEDGTLTFDVRLAPEGARLDAATSICGGGVAVTVDGGAAPLAVDVSGWQKALPGRGVVVFWVLAAGISGAVSLNLGVRRLRA